ncbi:ERV/ALR sulfhydryl oxidase domain-containing protein [Mycena floridula]|nr:ERV/ALR sulfhydryl oxidase domain-containing protein [Mycena floridula]
MISRFAKSFVMIIFTILIIAMIAFLHPPTRSYIDPFTGQILSEDSVNLKSPAEFSKPPPISGTQGHVIMSQLGNATAKAALGRATWKLLHTMTLRYPENPSPDEREALNSYFHLTSRLYPCGECAKEFQALLKEYPPQTSSRRAAALWLCSVHNVVNKRLEKEQFDCSNLDSEYDCGCGDAPVNNKEADGPANDPMDLEFDLSKDKLTGVALIEG